MPQCVEHGNAAQQRQRDGEREDPHLAARAQKEREHQNCQCAADQEVAPEVGADQPEHVGLAVDRNKTGPMG